MILGFRGKGLAGGHAACTRVAGKRVGGKGVFFEAQTSSGQFPSGLVPGNPFGAF